MATILDVAMAASAGAGTVSPVLNNSPRVSAASRPRVLSVVSQLDYCPSLAGKPRSWARPTLSVW